MFVKENPDRKKTEFCFTISKNRFRSMMGEELLNALSLVCFHRGIFLDYDKIIGISPSKYPRRMLLIIALSENQKQSTGGAL